MSTLVTPAGLAVAMDARPARPRLTRDQLLRRRHRAWYEANRAGDSIAYLAMLWGKGETTIRDGIRAHADVLRKLREALGDA